MYHPSERDAQDWTSKIKQFIGRDLNDTVTAEVLARILGAPIDRIHETANSTDAIDAKPTHAIIVYLAFWDFGIRAIPINTNRGIFALARVFALAKGVQAVCAAHSSPHQKQCEKEQCVFCSAGEAAHVQVQGERGIVRGIT